MRVALVISSLGPGGAERVMSMLANGLAARGHAVCLITLAGQAHDFYAVDAGVERRSLALTGDSAGVFKAVPANMRRLRALRRAIRAVAPDAVLAFVTQTNVLTLVACAGLPLRVVVSERIDPASHEERLVWRALRRLTYPRAARVVVQTEGIARWLRGGLSRPERIAVIPNPVSRPSDGLSPPAGLSVTGPYLLAAGRLVRQKGFDLLIRAFSLAVVALPELKLVIAGEGEELNSLRQLADNLGAGGAVVFVGTVSNLAELMRGATAFVLSSRYEGFPNVLLEALACGTPTIATDCADGTREILAGGHFGILVPCENAQALGLAMTTLVSDADLRRRLSELGPVAVKPYECARVLEAWEAVLGADV